MHAAGGRAIITGRRTEAEGVVSLTLGPLSGERLPDWTPGAHLDLCLDGDLIRQYSLCGRTDGPEYRIAVLREPDGSGGSCYVHDRLDVGDVVGYAGPRNHFELVDAPHYEFVAGGIGITPLMPMLTALTGAGASWRLLYGGRTRRSMAFTDELAEHGDRVTFAPEDETGLLDIDARLEGAPPGTAVYACGPGRLLDALGERCAAWPDGSLHVERFAPAPVEPDEPDHSFDVELKRSGLQLHVPAGRSVLEVVEAAGVGVMSSCTEGTCGSCETAVLDGAPDHRDVVLSDEERDEGRTMMICVSRCRGDRLELDL